MYRLPIYGAVLGALLAGPAYASSMTFLLGQSGTTGGAARDLKVAITDSASQAGALDFSVSPQAGLSGSWSGAAGLQAFGFNYDAHSAVRNAGAGSWTVTRTPLVISNLPTGWTVATDKTMGRYGPFDVRLSDTGKGMQAPLTFTVNGPSMDAIGDSFAARVAGAGTGAYFGTVASGSDGGGVTPPTAVPLPPAVFLFGAGLLGIAAITRPRWGGDGKDEEEDELLPAA